MTQPRPPEPGPYAGETDELPQVLLRHRQRTLVVSHAATFVAIGCVAVYALLLDPGANRRHLLVTLAVMAGGGVLIGLLPWPRLLASGRGEPILRAWSTISVLLIGAGIAETGGATSPLYLLYALSTVFFAAAYAFRIQLGLALASIASYLGAALVAGTQLEAKVVFIQVSLFVIVAALASHLSRELGTQLSAHVEARHEVESRARELARIAAHNEHLAHHDALTGLPNRNFFNERTESALASPRRRDVAAAVLVVDLDGFKEVNDALGHDNGDELLRQVGPRLQTSLHADAVVARMGGDGFAVLLPEVTSRAGVTDVAEKLVRALEQPFSLAELTLGIEDSVGVAIFPEHGESGDELIRHADAAMYAAKEDRAGWSIYDGSRHGIARQRVALLGDLRSALDAHQLVVHYQPLVQIADGSLRAVEALVRWQHPIRGLVPPADFIPLAEQTSLIRPLTLDVLGQALAQVRAWRDAGYEIPVSVNVSVRNLHDEQFPQDVGALLARSGLGPSALMLEITESAVMTHPKRAATVLNELDRMGVRLVLDDFGTGYSSLGYLTELPVQELKIDRTFVIKMHVDQRSHVIVRSIIDIGRNLDLVVVAEGVENEQVWDALARYGCEIAQGYFMSRPVPAAELGPWLERAHRNEQASAG